MLNEHPPLTTRDFAAFLALHADEGRDFELLDGEVYAIMPSSGKPSEISAEALGHLWLFLKQHPIAHITDAQGGYNLDEHTTVAPDVGVILKARLPTMPKSGFIPIRPDLVVEVISPSDLENPAERIDRKRQAYQKAGVPLLWYLYPETEQVYVYRAGTHEAQIIGADGTLSGDPVLPGFTPPVRDLFPPDQS
jgi:Uma2 family endonuclease